LGYKARLGSQGIPDTQLFFKAIGVDRGNSELSWSGILRANGEHEFWPPGVALGTKELLINRAAKRIKQTTQHCAN